MHKFPVKIALTGVALIIARCVALRLASGGEHSQFNERLVNAFGKANPQVSREAIRQALQDASTNAIPWLVENLAAHRPSALRRTAQSLAERKLGGWSTFRNWAYDVNTVERVRASLWVFRHYNHACAPAAPLLQLLTNNPAIDPAPAAVALAFITDTMPSDTNALVLYNLARY